MDMINEKKLIPTNNVKGSDENEIQNNIYIIIKTKNTIIACMYLCIILTMLCMISWILITIDLANKV